MRMNYDQVAEDARRKAVSLMIELMREKDWSQKQLAAELSVSSKTIENYLNNVSLPNFSSMVALCQIAQIPFNTLLEERCSLQDAQLYALIEMLSPKQKAFLIAFLECSFQK